MADRSTDTVLPGDSSGAVSSPAIGEVLAVRFEILRRLGSGGSAVVFAARDLLTGAEVAVKVLRSDRMSDKRIDRIRQEVNVAQRATSERLVRIFDLHGKHDRLFLTMELVDGGSLRNVIASAARMPIDEIVDIASQSALALADLHRLKIVHRDLKPGNLLLTRGGKVKLADFGLARIWDEDEHLTSSGVVVGTHAYVAPEQFCGASAGERSDLYSLGVVIYELLTGEMPALATSAASIRGKRTDAPQWLALLVARLLEREPRHRYGSAQELARDLQRRRVRPRRSNIAIAAATLFALMAGAFAFWIRGFVAIPRMAATSDGICAVDSRGQVLWSTSLVSRPGQIVTVHRGHWQKPLFAAVLLPPPTIDGPAARQLSFLDPRSGEIVSRVALPDGGGIFHRFANRFGVGALLSADLDGDGYDEVIVSYVHSVWWPSYSVVYDLRRGEARIVFAGGGHHVVAAAADLDGDGRKELLFVGTNNRMGWDIGVAAVRVDFDRWSAPDSLPLSPDGDWITANAEPLAWYALLPRGRLVSSPRVTVDEHMRTLTVNYVNRKIALDFDGFIAGSRSPLPAPTRAAARRVTYAHLHEAQRLTTAGDADDALHTIARARTETASVGDEWLSEWIARSEASMLVKFGHLGEADAAFRRLVASSAMPADIAWDAALGFHFAGDVDRAMRWYRQGYGRGAEANVGRLKWEFLQGMVFALCEQRRWQEADDEVGRFERLYPDQSGLSEWFRQYVVWRRGGVPVAGDLGLTAPDVILYWSLEFALKRGEPAERLLPRVEQSLTRLSDSPAMLLSIKAELLDRLGRHEEASAAASEAYERVSRDRWTDITARAHFDVVAERYQRLAAHGARGDL